MVSLKSLQDIEKKNWGDADSATTPLSKRCIQLTKVRIGDFTIEDLRVMISQGFGLIYLIPLAIEKLRENVFAEGDVYPGDLLNIVLKVDKCFWEENKQLLSNLTTVIEDHEAEIVDAGISLENFHPIK